MPVDSPLWLKEEQKAPFGRKKKKLYNNFMDSKDSPAASSKPKKSKSHKKKKKRLDIPSLIKEETAQDLVESIPLDNAARIDVPLAPSEIIYQSCLTSFSFLQKYDSLNFAPYKKSFY